MSAKHFVATVIAALLVSSFSTPATAVNFYFTNDLDSTPSNPNINLFVGQNSTLYLWAELEMSELVTGFSFDHLTASGSGRVSVDLFLTTGTPYSPFPAFDGVFTGVHLGLGDTALSLAELNTLGSMSTAADATITIFDFPTSLSQTAATWTGAGAGDSYNDPANWDINQVPVNNLTETFTVNIPSGNNVVFDVPGAGNSVDELAVGGTLTAEPTRELTILDNLTSTGVINSTGGTITSLSPGQTDTIDQARLFISGSGKVGVSATTYQGTFAGSRTIMQSSGSGSVLDLSSLTSMTVSDSNWSGEANHQLNVYALDNGVIDLSNLVSANLSSGQSTDRLRYLIRSGGNIDLSSLQSATRVSFDVVDPGGTYTLASLATANQTDFIAGDNLTFELPLLTTHSGNYNLGANAAVNAPILTNLTSGSHTLNIGSEINAGALTDLTSSSVNFVGAGTLNAPNLTNFSGSTLTLNPGATFNSGQLNSIDNARLFIQDQQVFDRVSATTYQGTFAGSRTIMQSSGSGSVLDLSSLTSMTVSDSNWSGEANHQLNVYALDNGVIDLSNLVSANLSSGQSTDRLRYLIRSGGNIDLSSLQSATRVSFDVVDPGGTYTLASLATANQTDFIAGDNLTFELPLLTTHSGNYNLGANAAVNAPILTNLTSGSHTLNIGSEINAGALTDLTSSSVNFVGAGTLNAPNLTNFSGSTLTLNPGATFNSGQLNSIDNARLFIQDQQVFDRVSATTYQGTFAGSRTIMQSSGSGSVLDLSSLTSMTVSDSNWSGEANHQLNVYALDNGVIDLSNLVSANLSSGQSTDRLRYLIRSGGNIDLSSLQSATRVSFDVASGGTLNVGDLSNLVNSNILADGSGTQINIKHDLFVDGSSLLSFTNGATLSVGGGFRHERTSEPSVNFDFGLIHFKGAGGQVMEVAGEDLGLGGPGSGNFGFKQMTIGEIGQTTSVSLIDLFDNGNRGGSGQEALYLYGKNGLEGLQIESESTLILNGINVYAWDILGNQMVHLNGLFGPGEIRRPFDNGYIQAVPLPGFRWTNPAGGDFGDPANWSNNVVPGAGDPAIFDRSVVDIGNNVVQFTADTTTDALIVEGNQVRLNLNGHTYAAAGASAPDGVVVRPGILADRNPAVIVDDGVLTSPSIVLAGEIVGRGFHAVLFVGLSGRVEATTAIRFEGQDASASGVLETHGAVSTPRLELDRFAMSKQQPVWVHLNGSLKIGTGPDPLSNTFVQYSDGVLAVELTSHDAPALSGIYMKRPDEAQAFLGGTLELSVDPAEPPDWYASHTVIFADSVTGRFEQITGVDSIPGSSLAVTYVNDGTFDRVQVMRARTGDANLDGAVDITDFNTLATNFDPGGINAPNNQWVDGNFDGDRDIDLTDFNLLATHFAPGGVDGTALVEEAAGVSEVDLIVDLATGEVVLDGNAAAISGLQVFSAGNSLLTTDFSAEVLQFVISTNASTYAEGAFIDTAVNGQVSLGILYDLLVDAQDLTFEYTMIGQSTVRGNVIYIPEPASLVLMGMGGLLALCRRRAA